MSTCPRIKAQSGITSELSVTADIIDLIFCKTKMI